MQVGAVGMALTDRGRKKGHRSRDNRSMALKVTRQIRFKSEPGGRDEVGSRSIEDLRWVEL